MNKSFIGIAINTYSVWLDEYVNAANIIGVKYLIIDFRRSDWMESALKCCIIIWRVHLNDYHTLEDARVKIPLIESKGVRCFPNSKAVFEYDNKVLQYYRMLEMCVPQPQTLISSCLKEIEILARSIKYPLVEKKPHGAGSVGVRLIESSKIALRSARLTLKKSVDPVSLFDRVGQYILRKTIPNMCKRYNPVLWQEYIGSKFDIRCAVYGNEYISVFKRINRKNDFRASGSGMWETMELCEVQKVYTFIKKHHHKFNVPFNAYDLICSGDEFVVLEYSYAVVLNDVYINNLYVSVNDKISRVLAKPFGVIQIEGITKFYNKPEE